jgi:hypothetical protein
MWLVRRLIGRRQAMSQPPARGTPAAAAASVRAYARWLNDNLGQLAEALLWGTPLAVLGSPRQQGALTAEEIRLRHTHSCLLRLREEAREHPPPSTLEPAGMHGEYVEILERSLSVVDRLTAGLERGDAETTAEASRELGQLATAAADLHARVLEQVFPSPPAAPGGVSEQHSS